MIKNNTFLTQHIELKKTHALLKEVLEEMDKSWGYDIEAVRYFIAQVILRMRKQR